MPASFMKYCLFNNHDVYFYDPCTGQIFQKIYTCGDGSCFFHAVSHDNSKQATTKKAMNFLINNYQLFEKDTRKKMIFMVGHTHAKDLVALLSETSPNTSSPSKENIDIQYIINNFDSFIEDNYFNKFLLYIETQHKTIKSDWQTTPTTGTLKIPVSEHIGTLWCLAHGITLNIFATSQTDTHNNRTITFNTSSKTSSKNHISIHNRDSTHFSAMIPYGQKIPKNM
jgi:hypothetical protein